MRIEAVAPTRLGLLKARRRLDRVRRGIDLLDRRRQALVEELFRQARPAAEARREIGERARAAYEALASALAVEGAAGLEARGWPPRPLELEVEPGQVWGVAVPRLEPPPALRRSLEARGAAPPGLPIATAETASRFETLLALLLEAAPRELILRRLGEALAKTSRQLNTLERRVAPELEERLGTVTRRLDEREREDQLRLRRLVR